MPSQVPVDLYFKHTRRNVKAENKIVNGTARSKCCKRQLTLDFFFNPAKNNLNLKTELKSIPNCEAGMKRTAIAERNLDAQLRQLLNVQHANVNSSMMFPRRRSNSVMGACGTITIDDDDDDKNNSDNENDVIFVSCQPGTSSGFKEKFKISKSPSSKEKLHVSKSPVKTMNNHLKSSQPIKKTSALRRIGNLITGDRRNKEKQEINISSKGSFRSGRNEAGTSGVLKRRTETGTSSILNGRNGAVSDILSGRNGASISGVLNGNNKASKLSDLKGKNKANMLGILNGSNGVSTSGVSSRKRKSDTDSGSKMASTLGVPSRKRKSGTDKAKKKAKTPDIYNNSSNANCSFPQCAGYSVPNMTVSNGNECSGMQGSKVGQTNDLESSQSVEFVREYIKDESNSILNKTCDNESRISSIQYREAKNKLKNLRSIVLENEENVAGDRVHYTSWKDKSPEHKNVVNSILCDLLTNNTVKGNRQSVEVTRKISGLLNTMPSASNPDNESNLPAKNPGKWIVSDFDGRNLEANRRGSGDLKNSHKPCSNLRFENTETTGSNNITVSEVRNNNFKNSAFKIDPKKLSGRTNTSPNNSNCFKKSSDKIYKNSEVVNTHSSHLACSKGQQIYASNFSAITRNIDDSDSEDYVIINDSEEFDDNSDLNRNSKVVDNNNPTYSKNFKKHAATSSTEDRGDGEDYVIINDSEELDESSNSKHVEVQLNAYKSLNKSGQTSKNSETCVNIDKSSKNVDTIRNHDISANLTSLSDFTNVQARISCTSQQMSETYQNISAIYENSDNHSRSISDSKVDQCLEQNHLETSRNSSIGKASSKILGALKTSEMADVNLDMISNIPVSVSKNLTISFCGLGEQMPDKYTEISQKSHQESNNASADSGVLFYSPNKSDNSKILSAETETLADKIKECRKKIRDKLETSSNDPPTDSFKKHGSSVKHTFLDISKCTDESRKNTEKSANSRIIASFAIESAVTEKNPVGFKCRKQLDLSSNNTINANKTDYPLRKIVPVVKEENVDTDEEGRSSPSILNFQGNVVCSDRHIGRNSSTSGIQSLTTNCLPSTSRIQTSSGAFTTNTEQNVSPKKVFKFSCSPVVSPKTSPAKRAAIKFIKKAKKISQRIQANASPNSKSVNGAVMSNEMTSPSKKKTVKEQAQGNMTHVYFFYFSTILVEVLKKMATYNCLSPDEFLIIASYHQLDTSAKKLYVRMLCRKYDWHRVADIKYSDISSNLVPYYQELERNNFITFDYNDEELDKMLHMLSSPELKELSKHFNLPWNKNKTHLIQELLKYGKTQKTMFTQTDSNDIVKKKVREMLGDCFKLRDLPRNVLLRLFLIYILPISTPGHLELFPTFMMVYSVENNVTKYFDYHVSLSDSAHTYLFRENIISLHYAKDQQNIFLDAVLRKDYECARNIVRNAQQCLLDLLSCEDLSERVKKLPLFLRRFMAGSAFAHIITDGIDILKKEQNLLIEATQMLNMLLDQDLYLVHYRGAWYDKLSLLFHRHLNNHTKAAEVIIKALKDEHLDEVKKYALNIRGLKLHDAKKTDLTKVMKRQLYHALEDESKLPDPPSITINGKSLPSNKSGNKRVYVQEDAEEQATSYLSVEELALSHYQKNGYVEGQHFENTIINSLFGLLFWDVIYETALPDVFQSKYQTKPLDLNYPEFYINRKELIHQKITSMKNMTIEQLQDLMKERFELHTGTESIVNWTALQSSENISTLLSCLTPNLIVTICERLLKNYRIARSGFPDLVVWSPEHFKCKFVEVKGPSDTLSDNQKLWLHYLILAGADAEVCHVKTTGSQSAKLKSKPETSTTAETARNESA